jgi:hypothetical protein
MVFKQFSLILLTLLQFSILSAKEEALPSLAMDSTFRTEEQKLSMLAKEIQLAKFNNALQDSLSQLLSAQLFDVLSKENSLHFPFDSLQGIGVCTSNDKNLRIYNWNIVYEDGSYKYFGWLQYYSKPHREVLLFELNDQSANIENPEKASLSHENWYGAAYYEIIDAKIDKETVYTLLGWDGYGDFTTKKVIDAVRFTESGKPKFNNNVFRVGRSKQKRVIYEFSYMCSMMLQYDASYDLIVMEHLEPLPGYFGNPMYYGPDLSYDAFRLEKEGWLFMSDIQYKQKEKKNTFSIKGIFKK